MSFFPAPRTGVENGIAIKIFSKSQKLFTAATAAVRKSSGQFHQHYTCSFYIRKLCAQLFCAYTLGLCFTGARLLSQKLRLERWWNWAQELQSRTIDHKSELSTQLLKGDATLTTRTVINDSFFKKEIETFFSVPRKKRIYSFRKLRIDKAVWEDNPIKVINS